MSKNISSCQSEEFSNCLAQSEKKSISYGNFQIRLSTHVSVKKTCVKRKIQFVPRAESKKRESCIGHILLLCPCPPPGGVLSAKGDKYGSKFRPPQTEQYLALNNAEENFEGSCSQTFQHGRSSDGLCQSDGSCDKQREHPASLCRLPVLPND